MKVTWVCNHEVTKPCGLPTARLCLKDFKSSNCHYTEGERERSFMNRVMIKCALTYIE